MESLRGKLRERPGQPEVDRRPGRDVQNDDLRDGQFNQNGSACLSTRRACLVLPATPTA